MSNHSELLKTAQKLANHLNQTGPGSNPIPHDGARMIRTLAAVVEAQDKPVAVNAELRAACATCEEEIGKTLDSFDHVDDVLGLDASECWIGLRAARKLAQIAVENHEKARGGDGDFVDADEFKGKLDVEQRVVATLREAEAKYDKLMDAVDVDDNQPKGN